MKKPYVKPELAVILPGSPKHKHIIEMLKAEEKKEQTSDTAK